MPIPASILERIETFGRNLESYLDPDYKEAQLRREFLDPLFEALGWDVGNRAGYAEAYKDVVHEDSLKVPGLAATAPDYSFRIGGTRKFFVEAKKPSVRIKDDPAPAAQLRSYSYSAKLPLGIVTDFHEFAIYETRQRPRESDKASAGRIFYCTFDQYPEKWEEIAAIFSREAVLKGSFDKYAASTRGKRGTSDFDDDFLADLESWRDLLARNFALRNDLTQRELNFAVQRTLDRVIFLRIAEDRGIEPYGQLLALTAGPKIYPRLAEIFERADFRYNSGLFHFAAERGRDESPDRLTLRLALDDAVLKEILGALYWPKSPYRFAVIPADILGHIYEQFLGKVIHLTSDHKARVEEKPEVRKAGGVYYTPTYIVDYIVRQTVGPLLERRTPKQVEKIRVLDPACGSGSFLLGAYEFLLAWHLDYYLKNDPAAWAKKKTPPIYETAPNAHGIGHGTKNFQLTTAERKRILVNNLFGVDIDAQAVEVTKLSLLLKVLEGEARELQGKQLDFHRVLPDLGQNIKCGNSLIGSDFYAQPALPDFDDEARYRINAFDWAVEFKSIMEAGGFDAVIGNPPWGQKETSLDAPTKDYLRTRFVSLAGIFDLFRPFAELAFRLVRSDGMVGQVLPDIVLLKDYAETRLLLLEHSIQCIDWWGMAFPDAVIDAATVVVLKARPTATHAVRVSVHDEKPFTHLVPQSDFRSNRRYVFNLFLTPERRALVSKLEQMPRFGDRFEIHEGVHSGNIRDELFVAEKIDSSCREMYFGRDEIRRHYLSWHGKFLRLNAAPAKKTKQRYANVGKPEWFETEKLLVRRTGDFVMAAFDASQRYASNNFFVAIPKSEEKRDDCLFACALLNSKLMTWYFRAIEPRKGRVFAELKIKHLESFPVPVGPAVRQKLVAAASKMIELHARLVTARAPDLVTQLQREIAATDLYISTLTYQLYALTPHEMAIVERESTSTATCEEKNPAATAFEKSASSTYPPQSEVELHRVAEHGPA
ncbi:MAG TPA: TaqI-like C-terminal specificity domain-containing protein [Opitutaceae bacterium]|nr:TaqI-like C-terminal specificity domain-containing protein [Opitutaceae bacterium]